MSKDISLIIDIIIEEIKKAACVISVHFKMPVTSTLRSSFDVSHDGNLRKTE